MNLAPCVFLRTFLQHDKGKHWLFKRTREAGQELETHGCGRAIQ